MDQEHYKLGLRRTAERIVKLMELKAPGVIVTNELLLALKRAFLAYPDDMAKGFGNWILLNTRVGMGLCRDCGQDDADPNSPVGLCTKCENKEKEEFGHMDDDIDELGEEGLLN